MFSTNRQKVINQLKPGSVALVFSAYQMPRNGDQFYKYRQNSDFFYLTGIEQEKSILMLCNNAGKEELEEVLFVIKPNAKLEIWEGYKLTNEKAQAISAIQTIKYVDDFEQELHSLLCRNKVVYLNIPEDPKFKPEVQSPDFNFLKSLKEQYPLHSFQNLAPILKELRLIKSESEITLIKKACHYTGAAFKRVLDTLRPGMMEYEVEAEIEYEFLKSGSSGPAYATIAASGKNACVLHYVENDCTCANGDLLLLDFGAEYANYAGDLSRTIPVNGKFTARQKEVYEATLRIFKFAKSLMKSGTTINSLHAEVCKMSEEEQIKLGLFSREESANNQLADPLWFNYFMHGTSHFMGLDVHDYGTRDTVLKPGMVITCEPGIYIAEEGIGVRIENDILITEDGNIDLMENIPIEVEEIEGLMKRS